MKNGIQALLLVLLAHSVAVADVVVTLETTGPKGSAEIGKMYVSGKKLRMEHRNGEDGLTETSQQIIFRGDKQIMITLSPTKKEFVEISKADMSVLASRMNSAMSQLETHLAKLPPDQRQKMEAMVGDVMKKGREPLKAPPAVRATGEKQTISGFACEKYEVTRGSEKTREYWVASPGALSGGDELRAAFEAMGGFFEELVSTMSQGPFANAVENPYSEFAKINGVPILTRQFENGRVKRETLIRSVKGEPVESVMFEVPADYVRRSVKEGL